MWAEKKMWGDEKKIRSGEEDMMRKKYEVENKI